ncbi:hypothetical protein BC629DRAFT_1540779 [Irpex lacteus]|nr:hypothetical protein BC629DRAFT_1540779 [Irpex lacteus]
MSSATTSTSNVGGFLNVWGVYHIANCFQISAFVLCMFEHIATFDLEITRVWRRRLSPVTLLFIINRYACLSYAASCLVQLAAWGNVDSRRADNMLSVLGYVGLDSVRKFRSLTDTFGVCSCNITSRIGNFCEDAMYFMFAFFAAHQEKPPMHIGAIGAYAGQCHRISQISFATPGSERL